MKKNQERRLHRKNAKIVKEGGTPMTLSRPIKPDTTVSCFSRFSTLVYLACVLGPAARDFTACPSSPRRACQTASPNSSVFLSSVLGMRGVDPLLSASVRPLRPNGPHEDEPQVSPLGRVQFWSPAAHTIFCHCCSSQCYQPSAGRVRIRWLFCAGRSEPVGDEPTAHGHGHGLSSPRAVELSSHVGDTLAHVAC